MLFAVSEAPRNAAVAASTVHGATDGDDVEDDAIAVEDVDDSTVAQLSKQAETYGRSLQEEIKVILSRASKEFS